MFRFHTNISEIPDIASVTTPMGRWYVTPQGKKYTSVTTFLNSLSEPWLEKWKKEVGEEYAKEVSDKARWRGTRYHNMVEMYLRTSDRRLVLSESMQPMQQMFTDSESTINRINDIHYIEKALYSDKLRLAGRVDVIACFDGKLSIIDFKTSTREKFEDEIEDYFLQATAYAMMYEEWTNYEIEQIVIVMLCDDMLVPKVFIKNPKAYHNILINKIEQFHSNKG